MPIDVLSAPVTEQASPIACPFEPARLELTVDREATDEEIVLYQAWEHAVGRWHLAVLARGLGQTVTKLGLGLMSGLAGALVAQHMVPAGLEVAGLTAALVVVRGLLLKTQSDRIAGLEAEIVEIERVAAGL